MHLLQPVLSGPDAADFNFSEQHGFECLWNGDREMCNGTTKKSMHDGIVRATCDVFERLHGGRRVVHERDDLMRHMEYTDAHGVRHRPDLAINDYCSSGLKRVYDVTLVAPIGRITVAEKVTIVARVDHHGDAERAKRAKPAWSNYAAQDRSRANVRAFNARLVWLTWTGIRANLQGTRDRASTSHAPLWQQYRSVERGAAEHFRSNARLALQADALVHQYLRFERDWAIRVQRA